jgi:penicillin-binding protein 2
VSDSSRVRVSIVGVVVIALFASLFVRLWFLQMGPDQKLGAVASTLATRLVQTASPRGEILDRNGKVLAQDVASWAVTVDRNLKFATRNRVLGQLAEVLAVPEKTLLANYNSVRQSPLKPAVVWLQLTIAQRLAILEHSQAYPGVAVTELTVRKYPYDGYASQLLGYVGEINDTQLKTLKPKGYQAGDLIGRDGVEAVSESVLRGKPRRATVQVDPTGKQVGPPVSDYPGTVGDDVKLTIDINWQIAAENALKQGIAVARTDQDPSFTAGYKTLQPTGGAVVVLDTSNGSVVAMASNPTYPLSWWVGGISADRYALLSNPGAQNPLVNRATQGLYAPGSTFKIVPSIALNQDNVLGASTYINDPGFIKIGDRTFRNDNFAVNNQVNLQKALTVSSDVYFYNAGNLFWNLWRVGDPRGLGIQTVAGQLGFGKPTGIELGESTGRIPDPAWVVAFANANYKKGTQPWLDHSTWYPGNNVNAAVGQGDDVVTPLQLANAYACFANAATTGGVGTLWTPHVEQAVINPMTNTPISTYKPQPRGSVNIGSYTYAQMAAGFAGVVSDPTGTANLAFKGLFATASGKTGTAQVTGKGPTSLFASYFSAKGHEYAAVAVVEQGGHGAQTAAPIVRQVIEAMNGLPITPITKSAPGKD